MQCQPTKLLELTAEIFVNNEDDKLTIKDEDMTVSVNEATHESEIQSTRKKIESDICKLIDLFKLPQYQKQILPSMESQKFSKSLSQENKDQYQWMVHLGTKLVKCVFDSLCPGPSQRQVNDDIIHLLLHGS